jgi:hypothetical protein
VSKFYIKNAKIECVVLGNCQEAMERLGTLSLGAEGGAKGTTAFARVCALLLLLRAFELTFGL